MDLCWIIWRLANIGFQSSWFSRIFLLPFIFQFLEMTFWSVTISIGKILFVKNWKIDNSFSCQPPLPFGQFIWGVFSAVEHCDFEIGHKCWSSCHSSLPVPFHIWAAVIIACLNLWCNVLRVSSVPSVIEFVQNYYFFHFLFSRQFSNHVTYFISWQEYFFSLVPCVCPLACVLRDQLTDLKPRVNSFEHNLCVSVIVCFSVTSRMVYVPDEDEDFVSPLKQK